MKRNYVWKYALGTAVIMMLAPTVSQAQSSQGLNLMITGNKESGFQFIQTTDTFYNGKGDKIVMAYTAPVCKPVKNSNDVNKKPRESAPENMAKPGPAKENPSLQKAKKKNHRKYFRNATRGAGRKYDGQRKADTASRDSGVNRDKRQRRGQVRWYMP